MLVHICCSVDSHYFLQKLRGDYPDEKITGYFYNPNIHPYSEYMLRLIDVRRSCEMLDIELIEGEYDIDTWFKMTSGLEREPEKGARCNVCFEGRFEKTAKQAMRMGEQIFTSTLLLSPKKLRQSLVDIGRSIALEHGLDFLSPDYRKGSGTQEQNALAKEARLYRQNYCGCIYALKRQRDEMGMYADELLSPISGQVQPGSLDDRLRIYRKRLELEKNDMSYLLGKERFLRWRLESLKVKNSERIITAHALPYSTAGHRRIRGKVTYEYHGIYFMDRGAVRIISIDKYNDLCESSYRNTLELIFDPPKFEKELLIRREICPDPLDMGTILVVDKIPEERIDIEIVSTVFVSERDWLHYD